MTPRRQAQRCSAALATRSHAWPPAARHHRHARPRRLRRHAVARTLFTPTTLPSAIARLGFVQADPIRAPARAQDLTLRHRVRDYRAGDLERRYPRLAIEEDFFVNYGFLPRATQALMHPRTPRTRVAEGALGAGRTRCWTSCASAAWCTRARSTRISQHGKARNWFGGSSQRQHAAARRHALPRPAARGAARGRHALLRGARRARRRAGDADARAGRAGRRDRRASTRRCRRRRWASWCSHLRGGAPQWADGRARGAGSAPGRGCRRRAVDGIDWYWPAGENPAVAAPRARRRRCACSRPSTRWCGTAAASSCFWGWAYRFEAYTPAPKRAARLLRAAAAVARPGDRLGQPGAARRRAAMADLGYVAGKAPRDAAFRRALDDELGRMRAVPAAALAAAAPDRRARPAARCATSAKPSPRSARRHVGRPARCSCASEAAHVGHAHRQRQVLEHQLVVGRVADVEPFGRRRRSRPSALLHRPARAAPLVVRRRSSR